MIHCLDPDGRVLPAYVSVFVPVPPPTWTPGTRTTVVTGVAGVVLTTVAVKNEAMPGGYRGYKEIKIEHDPKIEIRSMWLKPGQKPNKQNF